MIIKYGLSEKERGGNNASECDGGGDRRKKGNKSCRSRYL